MSSVVLLLVRLLGPSVSGSDVRVGRTLRLKQFWQKRQAGLETPPHQCFSRAHSGGGVFGTAVVQQCQVRISLGDDFLGHFDGAFSLAVGLVENIFMPNSNVVNSIRII